MNNLASYWFARLGILGIIWSVFWFWLITDSPFDHPTITDQELEYLKKELADDKTESTVSVLIRHIILWYYVYLPKRGMRKRGRPRRNVMTDDPSRRREKDRIWDERTSGTGKGSTEMRWKVAGEHGWVEGRQQNTNKNTSIWKLD